MRKVCGGVSTISKGKIYVFIETRDDINKPSVSIDEELYCTPSEARELAALLVKCADEMDRKVT